MENRKLYQLNDSDLDSVGILSTNCPEEEVQKQWEKFYNDTFEEGDTLPSNGDWSIDFSVDNFATFLVELGFEAERVYVTDINS